jgi:hypothetical protein
MATLTALPPALRGKLAAAARHIRFLRAVRGLSLLLLVLALTAEVALLADAALGLPPLVREGLLAAWLALGLGLALFGLLVPLCRRLAPEDLAALVEEKYPDLGERLTSTVELAGADDAHHGSRALIRLLMHDTEARTLGLSFARAVPAGGVPMLALSAALLALLAFAPALAWPGKYADLGNRFLFPWRVPPAVAPYALEVTPGDVFAAQGRPLTVTVRIVPRNEKVALPATCTLVLTDGAGNVSRRPMLVERQDQFALKLDRVPGDFRYRAEAGEVTSPDYLVSAVEPVELAADSPTITVTAPPYARATIPSQTLHGLQDVSALQYSRIRFAFRFTRPAQSAAFTWTPAPGKGEAKPDAAVTTPLDLAADRRGATLDLPADGNGRYRLVLKAEHDIITEVDPRTLAVRIDQPPALTKVVVPGDVKFVLPYDRVPLELTAADDVGVAEAAVEYRVGDGPPASEPIALRGAGSQEAAGRHSFDLAGKAREGDVVRYRLRVADNRSVPEHGLKPHVIYHPDGDRWLTLRVVRQAEPLKQQEILAQRDSLRRKLDAIAEDLKQEQRGVYRVRQESRTTPELTPEQRRQTKDLRQQNRHTEDALRDVAREAAAVPALGKIADGARDVAEQQMPRSDTALRDAQKEGVKPPQRDTDFVKSDEELTTALWRVEELRRLNEKLARERLDQMKLELAAEREKQLAERAAELAAKDPVKDPASAKETEELRRKQNEVAAELERLAQQSEALRDALDAARAEQARQLAERARDLAKQQRVLAKGDRPADPKKQAELDDLARKQQELAEKARRLARETRTATEAAKASPLKSEEAERAADALKHNDVGEAVRHQDQAAGELDRLANDLDRAADLAKDPREVAHQLARVEEGMQKRLTAEAPKDARRLEEMRREQAAVARAAEQVSVPPQNQAAQQERRQAASRAEQAADALKRQDRDQAAAQMAEAARALRRLMDKLPPLEQRRQEARAEVARLRQQQEQTAQLAEQAVKQVEKQDPNAASTRAKLAQLLTESARRQAETAERLGKMDAANQEARRQRVQEALNEALADLMDARPQDVAASQQAARRQLERLDQALAGQKPADDKARELADRQQRLADEAARAAADPKAPPAKQQELQQKQQQLAGEARVLQAPEAPQRRAEAAEAAGRAEQAAAQPANAETAKRMQEAARALDRLARQMAGAESEAARAERLARRQAEVAAEAERSARAQPGKRPTPEAERRQQQVADEAKQVRAGEEAQAEKQKALQALTRARQPGKAQDLAGPQRQAADALRALADKLAGRTDPTAKSAAPKEPPAGQPVEHTAAKPDDSPRHGARELARQQGELAKATRQAQQQADANPGAPGKQALERALEQLGEQQRRLNERASRLPTNQAQKQLEQAREAMNQARQALGKSDASQAYQKQREASHLLDSLAGRLPEQPAASRQADAAPAPDLPSRQQGEQARDLARQQRALRDAVQQRSQTEAASKGAMPQADLARQKELQRQAGELMQNLNRLAQQMTRSPQAQQSAQQAAQSSQQAQGQMQQAQDQGRQGNAGPAHQAQQQAAQALDRAAGQAEQAGRQMEAARRFARGTGRPEAGQAVQQAQGQMQQAQQQLGQGQARGAHGAMEQAAEALRRAAQQLAQQQQGQGHPREDGEPGPQGASGEGRVDGSLLPADQQQYAGKRWGELPGELRTRLVQDMQAKYGEDYARIIKLYFEQIADTKKK